MKKIFIFAFALCVAVIGVIAQSSTDGGGGSTTPTLLFNYTSGSGILFSTNNGVITVSTNFTVSAGSSQVVTNGGNNVYTLGSVTNYFSSRSVFGSNVWATANLSTHVCAQFFLPGTAGGICFGTPDGFGQLYKTGNTGANNIELDAPTSSGIYLATSYGSASIMELDIGGGGVAESVMAFKSDLTTQIGTNGTAVTFLKTATSVIDFGQIASLATSNKTITVGGTIPGDHAVFTLGSSNYVAGIVYQAWPTNNGVFVTGFNPSAAPVTTSPGTGRVTVIHP